jgi:hypothetical protein
MSSFIVVLDDGETYAGVGGCSIYRVKDEAAFAELEFADRAVRDGVDKGILEYNGEVSDLLDCEE